MSYIGSGLTRFNTADDLTVTDDAEIGGDLTVTGSADINGGTIDGVTIGGASAGAGTFTTLQADTSLNVDGTVTADGLNVDDVVSINTSSGEAFSSTGNLRIDIDDDDNANDRVFEVTANGSAKTLLTVDENNDISFYEDTGTTPKLFWDASAESLGIGTTDPKGELHIRADTPSLYIQSDNGEACDIIFGDETDQSRGRIRYDSSDNMIFQVNNLQEAMRIDSNENLLHDKTVLSDTSHGVTLRRQGVNSVDVTGDGVFLMMLNRQDSDGTLMQFRQANSTEGTISVSGSTVTLNGAHLSRWSRLTDDSKDASILRGTVMTNLDEMCEWKKIDFQDPDSEEENIVSADYDGDADVGETIEWDYLGRKVTGTISLSENEQLNKMDISSVEGDPNVAGVFVNWDESDNYGDMSIAMTGDMVIRIAQGTTVQRGDLLMSAGDGTAKPQGDDIVRSKTIAKVTSTHVSHTYDDGSYLVPCVLMAC